MKAESPMTRNYFLLLTHCDHGWLLQIWEGKHPKNPQAPCWRSYQELGGSLSLSNSNWVERNPDWVLALTRKSVARQSLCPEKSVKARGAGRYYQSRWVKFQVEGSVPRLSDREVKGEGCAQELSRWEMSLVSHRRHQHHQSWSLIDAEAPAPWDGYIRKSRLGWESDGIGRKAFLTWTKNL